MKTLFIPLLAGLLLSCPASVLQAQDGKEKEKKEQLEAREKERLERQEAKEKEREEKNESRDAEREVKNREREERNRLRYNEKYPEEFKEHISKQYTIQKTAGSVLTIYNLDGFIKVGGYGGDKVIIEIDKTVRAKDKETMEQAKKEIKIGFEQIGDSVVTYLLAPWDTRPHEEKYNWEDRERKRIEYNCNLQYTVKVPFGMNLRVGTINNGDIDIKNVTGALHVNNINGGIAIANAKGTTWAHTINGDLTVNYLSNPPEASSFYTLNGKLTAIFQPNLAADLQFKTMNGAFYTDFDNAQTLSPTVTKNEEKRGGGTLYKLNKDTQLRIGAGGKQFKFETLNGNIYIKKQS
ncbi:MAG: hypothetical protein ABIS69_05680 [Sediminibacterium sp.]